MVDGIQRKFNVHYDQRTESGYDKKNIPIAMNEAKSMVAELLAQQKQGGIERPTAYSGRLKPALGLAALLAGIAFLAGFPYIPPPLY